MTDDTRDEQVRKLAEAHLWRPNEQSEEYHPRWAAAILDAIDARFAALTAGLAQRDEELDRVHRAYEVMVEATRGTEAERRASQVLAGETPAATAPSARPWTPADVEDYAEHAYEREQRSKTQSAKAPRERAEGPSFDERYPVRVQLVASDLENTMGAYWSLRYTNRPSSDPSTDEYPSVAYVRASDFDELAEALRVTVATHRAIRVLSAGEQNQRWEHGKAIEEGEAILAKLDAARGKEK